VKQLVVSAIPVPGELIKLTEEQYHYLVRVRRVTEGMEISCIDGGGHRATTVVVAQAGNDDPVALRVVHRSETDGSRSSPRSAIPVTLYMALLKGKKLDTVVRQVTELGVDRIVPVITQHCVSRPAADDLQRKGRRWEGIVREATQQSGRATIPTVERVAVLRDVGSAQSREHAPPPLSLVFHEAAETVLSISDTVRSSRPPGEIRVLVGPEGGLAPGEIDYLVDHGWQANRMPAPVLRAETAAVAAATLVQSLRSEYTASAS